MRTSKLLHAAAVSAATFISAAQGHASSLDIAMGKAMFDRLWTSAPASTDATDGLGPLFNARSCAACHPRGKRSSAVTDENGQVIRSGVTVKLGDAHGNPDPVYGGQLQSNAVQGLTAEGSVAFNANESRMSPYRITNLAYGPLASDTRISGRIAPTLLGSGWLDAIPEEEILKKADPDDRDGDGISGRVHWVKDADGDRRVGRFGWKAMQPDLAGQIAAALHFDMGLSSPLIDRHEGDCTQAQTDCVSAPHGNSARFNDLEIGSDGLRVLVAYTANLKPTKTPEDAQGSALFSKVGCASCHSPEVRLESGKVITPYTDLLLHDMGPALDDGVKEGDAESFEWRTAPLWGLGHTVQSGLGLMHDGRAKTLVDAIRLHDGEAKQSREAFAGLSTPDQNLLLRFLENL